MKSKDLGILFLLATLWGSSFLFMRIISPVLGPFLTIELRVLIAGLALLIYAQIIKRKLEFRKRWKEYLILGGLNAAIPFTLIATALLTINSSMAAILNSTTPLFGAIVAWVWIKETLTFKKVVGIILGINGVIILLGWSPVPFSLQVVFSASLSICAAISYGFGGVYARKTFTNVDPLSLATGQQLAAALLLFPLAITKLPVGPIPPIVMISVAGLAILCTSVAYLLYFHLIASIGSTNTLSVTILVPLFGVIWGYVFLQEPISIGMILGLVVILSSIFVLSDMKFKTSKTNKQLGA